MYDWMLTSEGRSVMRNRMLLYSMSEGAGRMSFCFMLLMYTVHSREGDRSVTNRQIVTLFPHDTRQTRYFVLERVRLHRENYPHGGRFQPRERIRSRTNSSSKRGMKLKNYAKIISRVGSLRRRRLNDMLRCDSGSRV